MDSKKDKYTTETWKQLVVLVCQLLRSSQILVFDMSDNTKWSTHLVVVDSWQDSADSCLVTYEQILDNILDNDKDTLDRSVYKHVQYFRVEGSAKTVTGSRKKKLTSVWNGEGFEPLKTKTSTLVCHPGYMDTYIKPLKSTCTPGNVYNSIPCSSNICDVPVGFKIRKIIDNLVVLDRVIPTWCEICNRVHDNEGAFIKNGRFYCRRAHQMLYVR